MINTSLRTTITNDKESSKLKLHLQVGMFVCLFWLIELLIVFVLCYYVEKNEELYQTITFDFFFVLFISR